MHLVLSNPENSHFTDEDVEVFEAVRYWFGKDNRDRVELEHDEMMQRVSGDPSNVVSTAQQCYVRAFADHGFRALPPVREAIATRRDEIEQRLSSW
ncbi:hypothetical protein [Erythrobacter sp. EC-HK427]|uniref:hypothetical protein n=1 Tax=Erythrobacter sp. EC-HK427 TaxID=2038396 RepID=UPI00125ED667|nr:hypothetical protein [Erythrobacter sp. EC-HK427]